MRRLVPALYWTVAAEFLLGAITKYWPGTGPLGQDYAAKFADWGYPSGFRFLVGTLELLGALLLATPRKQARFLGATGLVLVLTGAVTTHIVNHDKLADSAQAPIHLLITVAIALANWPPDWRDLLRRWQSDTATRTRHQPPQSPTPKTPHTTGTS